MIAGSSSKYALFTLLLIYSAQSTAINQCSQSYQCNPVELGNTSISFIQCLIENGQCQCNDCFLLNSTVNRCYILSNCTSYNNSTRQCTDIRRSRTNAIIYSAILTISGAANFYIERWELAIPQLLLGISFTLLPFIGVCIKGALDHRYDEDYEGPVKIISWTLLGMISVLVTTPMAVWYIIDLVTFINNTRLDGRGCPLH